MKDSADPPLFKSSRGIAGLRKAQASYYGRRFGVKLEPRYPGRRDAGLQGRLRQHGVGHHRAGRRGAGAQPDLPDPLVRLHHELAAWSAPCRPNPTKTSCARSTGPCGTRSPSRSRWCSTTRPTRPPTRRRSISTKRSSPTVSRTTSSSSPILPIPRSTSTTTCRRRCCSAGRHRHHGRVHLDVEDLLDAGLARRLGAVGNERLIAALARVKSYLDYGAFTPIQVAAACGAQRR